MLQRLSIRGKILAVVAVPILVLLLAVGVVTLNATQTLNSAQNIEQLLSVLNTGRNLESSLQTERKLSVNYVDAYSDGLKKRGEAEDSTDEAVAGLDAAVAENPTPEGEASLAKVNEVINRTAPDVFLADLRAVDVTENSVGEWPTFPSPEETQATADAYAAIGAEIDTIIEGTDAEAGIRSNLARLAFAVKFEGDKTQEYLANPVPLQDALIAALPESDASQAAYVNATDGIADISENQPVLLTVADASQQLAQLPNVRTQVVNRSVSMTVLTRYYADTIEPVIKLSSDVASVASDRTLAGQLRAYNSMDVLVERVLSEEVYTDTLLRAGYFLPGSSTYQRSLVALSDIALTNAQDTVDPLAITDPVPPFGASADSATGDTWSFESIRTNIASGLDTALVTERGSDWPGQVAIELDAQIPIRDSLWDDARATSSAALQSTVLQTILTIVGAVLVVVATVFIALVIARRIIGPLRRLTTTATAVRQELPRMVERVAIPGQEVDVSEVQIPVESSDEIGRLAEAFNGVNAATLAIAGEQAALRGSISEMFVNVARRDQVLLNRQLSSIDEMERTEDDPATLTRLFALDHLATRMRRNSESLLVLAGIDTGRRLRRAMPLADVIRTASSEIELYERVQLELDADPAMVGHSALTAAHLFAELLENATVFSDPGSPVIVRTFERDGNTVVEIEDTGIGMSAHELQEANNRVASTAASEILGAQRLGLFVVGRIARRVGASVAIASSEGAGTVATVTMPPSLFDERVQEPTAPVSSSVADTSLHAPAALVGHSVSDEVMDNAMEPDATRRPGAPAYKPATVEAGAGLTGRAVDPPLIPDADESNASEPTVDELIAADAAAAPEATAVNAADLAGGLTASGLPARRRRANADAGVASDEEKAKIIGLPARATPDQLSALDADAESGFKPSVSPEEIAPQTAEERASMFRGFRSRKESEQVAAETVDPEAESMGQAARRSAFADHHTTGLDAKATPASAPDDAFVVPKLEDDDVAETEQSVEPVANTRPSFAMPKFDDSADRYRAPAAEPVAGSETTQEVLPTEPAQDSLSSPDDADGPEAAPEAWTIPQLEDDEPAPASADDAEFDDAPMVVPSFEDDEVPTEAHVWGAAPVAPEQYSPQPIDQVDPEPEYEPAPHEDSFVQPASSGVEEVSLETGPTFAEGPATALPARDLDPAELAALTATPSMDELMAGSEEEKPNFFSRLFGRGKKETAGSAPAAPLASTAPSPFAPTTEPVEPPAYNSATRGFMPTDDYSAPSAPVEAAHEPEVDSAPSPSAQQFTPWTPDEAPVSPAPTAFAPSREPIQDQGSESARDVEWPQPQDAPQSEPEHAPEPTPATSAATSFFSPRTDNAPRPQAFSPDELAKPVGWEAAGASALQAAAPDVQTSYTPKVDLDSDQGGAPDLSSVFSEFSSLSAERPKVEKTRAGLQKRRAADAPPVKVTPIEDEVVVAPRERNADDVRSRFSSFYSGTARARSDAAEFERSQATTETKE